MFPIHKGVWRKGDTAPLIRNVFMIWGSGQLHYTVSVGPGGKSSISSYNVGNLGHIYRESIIPAPTDNGITSLQISIP